MLPVYSLTHWQWTYLLATVVSTCHCIHFLVPVFPLYLLIKLSLCFLFISYAKKMYLCVTGQIIASECFWKKKLLIPLTAWLWWCQLQRYLHSYFSLLVLLLCAINLFHLCCAGYQYVQSTWTVGDIPCCWLVVLAALCISTCVCACLYD